VIARNILSRSLFAASFCAAASSIAFTQQDSLTSSPQQSVLKSQAVEYLYPEQVSVPAGKPSPVTLHFRVQQNLHINSHTPRADFLIPTVFSMPENSGVKLAGATYPTGADFALPSDPDQKLSVYTGDFTIQAKIVSTPGNHLVEAKLRYQACDQTQCLPPKTITVPIDVIGK
jgi:hypothetical protein